MSDGLKVSIAFFLTLLIVSAYSIYGITEYIALKEEISTLESKVFVLEMDNREQRNELEAIRSGNWIPMQVEATGYAPLDPAAVEGMCYSGDPRVTASRSQSDPSRTVAMGNSVPFGTKVYIPGVGHRVVEDRGGAITDKHIDIMFRTQKEALEYGRQTITVYIKK